MAKELPELSEYQYGFRDKDVSVYRSKKGLSREVVEEISRIKGEPEWMLEFRLKALEQFFQDAHAQRQEQQMVFHSPR